VRSVNIRNSAIERLSSSMLCNSATKVTYLVGASFSLAWKTVLSVTDLTRRN
jgi:hypothetical protein